MKLVESQEEPLNEVRVRLRKRYKKVVDYLVINKNGFHINEYGFHF